MYGKIFATMFNGSMIGSGAITFAVMSYVIANMRPSKEHGAIVEINPKLLAFTLGESEKGVQKALDTLCAPDKGSRTKAENGRRLVRLSEFEYRVVNGRKYREIRNEEDRREQNRQAQERFRQKRQARHPLPGELAYQKAVERGASEEELNNISEGGNHD